MAVCLSWSRVPGEGPRPEGMRGQARILASKISGRKSLVPQKGTDKACESYKEEGLLFSEGSQEGCLEETFQHSMRMGAGKDSDTTWDSC